MRCWCCFVHRYHHTIKSVVRSTQVSVPTLIRNLLQLSDVRLLTSQHTAFDRMLKQPVSVPAELTEYRTCVSQFAFELIHREFNKSRNREPDPQFCGPCACTFASTYNLPCRHFFAHCRANDMDTFDASLISERWTPTTAAVQTVNSQSATTGQMTFQTACRTQQERFKVALSRCTVIASVMADVPAAEFPQALAWLEKVENEAKSAIWRNTAPVQSSDTVTDVGSTMTASDVPSTSTSQVSGVSSSSPVLRTSTASAAANDAVDVVDDGHSVVQSADMLHYPQAVSQRGRPQKRKQRLFDSVNRLVPFEKWTPARRDEFRLSWIAGEQIARQALRNGYMLQPSDIPTSSEVLSLCKDERVRLTEIRHYFTDAAWSCLQARIDSFNAEDSVCAECGRQSGVGRQATIKWLQCDTSLKWLHLHCVGLSRQPRGHWFCRACETFTT